MAGRRKNEEACFLLHEVIARSSNFRLILSSNSRKDSILLDVFLRIVRIVDRSSLSLFLFTHTHTRINTLEIIARNYPRSDGTIRIGHRVGKAGEGRGYDAQRRARGHGRDAVDGREITNETSGIDSSWQLRC